MREGRRSPRYRLAEQRSREKTLESLVIMGSALVIGEYGNQ